MKTLVAAIIVLSCLSPARAQQTATTEPAGVSVEEAQRRLKARQEARDKAEGSGSQNAELERLRAEVDRLKRVIANHVEIETLLQQSIDIYRRQLAKYDPDFVAKLSESSRPNEAKVANSEETTRADNGKIVRDFIKTTVKPTGESPESTELYERSDENILTMVDSGIIEVEPETSTFRCLRDHWAAQSEENKKLLVASFSAFFIRHGKSGRVTVLSLNGSSELASYSVAGGVTLKR